MPLNYNGLFLAPLAGVSESIFRQICKQHGADTVVSEMASAEGLLRAGKQTLRLLAFKESERPIGIQLFGSVPERMAAAAQLVEEHCKPDFIDLNSGCPVPKVVSRNGGAALLRDRAAFEQIIAAMVKAVTIPITVKIRSGFYTNKWVDEEFAKAAEGSGASLITLHPRSKVMRYTGSALWERIALVKKAVSIPVIGNGDIKTPEDAMRMKRETGCDGLMIGRGALGNPWIFNQIKELEAGTIPSIVSFDERCRIMLHHLDLFRQEKSERLAARDMRKHIAWYFRGQRKATEYRDRIFRSHTTQEMEEIIREAQNDKSELDDSQGCV